jgi:elongation factor G
MGVTATKQPRAEEGDTVAFGRLDHVATGESFTDAKARAAAGNGSTAVLPKSPPPHPVHALAMRVRDRKDEVRLAAAMAKLAEEDPSLTFVQDQTSGEMKLFGQGEMHVRVALEKLAARFGVTVEAKKPSVSYRETVRDATTIRGRHKKQSGGHGQFGDVVIDIKPRARSEGFAFNETVHGGTVPRQYFSSVEAGCRDALARGPLGFPVVDVGVTLTDGSYHTVDSSDMAFRAAAKLAMNEGLPKCRPVLLEPILAVSIAAPSESLSRVTGIASARRGQILGYDSRPGWEGWDVVEALIPEAEMSDLIVELRSATAGVGTYTARFDHLAEISGRPAEAIVTQAAQARAAAAGH